MAGIKEKTEFQEILACGADFKNRRIYFGLDAEEEDEAGGFSWSSVETAIRALHKMVADYPKKPIELHMSSCGGDPTNMMRLYDEIQACPCRIIFIGGGQIASAATWIMAGCDERRVHKNTEILIHDGFSELSSDRHTEFMINSTSIDAQQKFLDQIFASNSRMPVEFWADISQRDCYLTPEEALKLGLIDKIIEPLKRGTLRKSRTALLSQHPDKKELSSLIKDIHKRQRRVKISKIEVHVPEEFDDTSLEVDSTPVPAEAPETPETT